MERIPSHEPNSSSLVDHRTVRAAYPALEHVVYLNVGSYGLMPEPALAVFTKALAEYERYGVASTGNLGEKVAEARALVAQLLVCEPDDVALTGNATDGTNLVLAGLEWRDGDEVISTDEEHESLVHPLLHLQTCKGVRVRWIPVSADPDVMRQRCESAATPRTRLLAFSHVTCETGTRLPVEAMCKWAASRGILSHVDGAHSLGTFSMDVGALGCDFFTSNGHKWLCGPKGTGIFYAHPQRMIELCPAHVGAGSLECADPSTGVADLWPSGRRFEYGTRSNALYAGLAASIDWLSGLGWAEIESYVTHLSSYLRERIAELPYARLLTPQKWEESSPLTAITVEGHEAGELSRSLRERWSIHVRVVPHYDAIRISTAHFNNEADIEKLVNALDTIVQEGA